MFHGRQTEDTSFRHQETYIPVERTVTMFDTTFLNY